MNIDVCTTTQHRVYESVTGPSYIEDISKNNQGGLYHRNCVGKKVKHFENKEFSQ